jgi:O-methyltransferase involved in polyketide biosynthesis
MTQQWRDLGVDLDFNELVYFGDRTPATTYLARHGWQVSASTYNELFAAHGLPILDEKEAAGFADTQYICATLPSADAEL